MSYKTRNTASSNPSRQLRKAANTKGTTSYRPAAKALSGRARRLPATANPDGRPNRPLQW